MQLQQIKPFQQARAGPVRQQPVRVVCQASTSTPAAPGRQFNPLLMGTVEALFRFPPFFNAAAKNARGMIMKRAEALGLDWNSAMAELKAQDWEARMKEVTNPNITYPAYYTQPFHAYSQGNLCWEAALEVTMAAKSVHAMVMDPAGKKMDPAGDAALRSSYSARMAESLDQLGVDRSTVKHIVDLGAATGLSSLELLRAFPQAHRVTGLDASPHFLAVGKWEQERRVAAAGGAPREEEKLVFLHGLAESTGLEAGSQDLVSMCLVCHELPQAATKAIMKEAFRILRPGGAMCIMEMNPESAVFQRIFGNPFAYTAFKSTEPWLQEYIALDMPDALREAGFAEVVTRESTPRHKTVVAIKK
ncbi:hypothetical protein HYH02_013696 [Chlamydomonas schloesseri]|uniref:Methyltransferase domain-containing protein n=1 Tax=Chlamydomonas schloesseri TaxID=2026947 RepID=A0A835SYR9_9CHLO|nr:hypothetical protein HYH02_013696 [Chlamydomonas schloesseri]|eukprot:KAG2430699.1 hypothetical protein HYH02_013696 [Chlamydomonas schloesseri]